MRRAAKPEQQAALEELVAFVNECNKEEVTVMEEEGGVKNGETGVKESGSSSASSKNGVGASSKNGVGESSKNGVGESSKEVIDESKEGVDESNEAMNQSNDSASSKPQPVPTTPTKQSSCSAMHTPILESRLSAKKRSSHMTTPEATKKRKIVQSDSDSLVCCLLIHGRR